MIELPTHLIGIELFWWQERADLHTLITIYGRAFDPELKERCLSFALFDQAGRPQWRWQTMLRDDGFVVIDSQRPPASARDARRVKEGVLAVFASTKDAPPEHLRKKYGRLYSMIDWYSEEGELCTLHSDQTLTSSGTPTEFTEIVFQETLEATNFLIILNGPDAQAVHSGRLEIKNHRGDVRTAIHSQPMGPFTVNKIQLGELFPGLPEFCDGQHVSLEGSFSAPGLFTRPYVMTQERHLCGYHGGNRYPWQGRGMPATFYKWWGRGEVNPMMVVHQKDLTTTVNVLNTHGDVEDDFWVDARLFDEAGRLCAVRERWLLAARHGLSRGNVRDLLADPDEPFRGHVALNFSADDKPVYPLRLQALLEYRTPVNVSRVMAWSDQWNSADRRNVKEPLVYRSYFRVWLKPPITSDIAITNCGIEEEYHSEVSFVLRVINSEGEALRHEGTIPPHGTSFISLEAAWPQISEFIGSVPVGVAVIESRADLAIVQISRHQRSGVCAIEHFMAVPTFHHGKRYSPAGA